MPTHIPHDKYETHTHTHTPTSSPPHIHTERTKQIHNHEHRQAPSHTNTHVPHNKSEAHILLELDQIRISPPIPIDPFFICPSCHRSLISIILSFCRC